MLALLALSGAVGLFATSDRYGTLVRNSLILDVAQPQEFEWLPEHPPADFIVETRDIDAPFRLDVASLAGRENSSASDDFATALVLARHLAEAPRSGGAIRENSASTYTKIRERGAGYCADYSQVFVALALANGLHAREWGLGFGDLGSGHAFNDVYVADYDKWVFLDVFNAFYVVDRATGIPISVPELHRVLVENQALDGLEVVPIDAERFPFRAPAKALEYYAAGTHHFYLFLGNNVISYDRHPVVRFGSAIARDLGILGGIAFGVHPRIRVLLTKTNVDEVRQLELLRYGLLGFLILAAALFAYVIVQLRRVVHPTPSPAGA